MPNFFQLYAQYTKDTEPPPNFHAWSAIAAISALLGKKVQINQGHYTVFPHLYIVLVGTPGTRKTTAAKIARNLVQFVDKIQIAPESASRESLIDVMSTAKVEHLGQAPYWQASSFGAELDQFLGGEHINKALVGFLTAIWDEPIFVEQTRKSGRVVIHNPYFTMLGCCTPTWITGKLKGGVITDGFARRVIFQLESERACLNPRPKTTPEKLEAMALFRNEVNRIFDMHGAFELTVEACHAFDKLYVETAARAEKFSEKVQSYFTSRHDLLYKVAMCISAGLNSSKLIDANTIDMADRYLRQYERNLDQIFASVGRNELHGYMELILERIRKAGMKGTTKAQMIQSSYDDLNRSELDEVWNTLIETGQVTILSPSSATELPRVRATSLEPTEPAENLLQSVSQLEVHPKQTKGENPTFSLVSHLAPATVSLITRITDSKALTSSGVLLRGTRSLAAASAESSSTKPAESSVPQTPPSG